MPLKVPGRAGARSAASKTTPTAAGGSRVLNERFFSILAPPTQTDCCCVYKKPAGRPQNTRDLPETRVWALQPPSQRAGRCPYVSRYGSLVKNQAVNAPRSRNSTRWINETRGALDNDLGRMSPSAPPFLKLPSATSPGVH